ncbi:MAG: hypothetical protein R2705_16485 [Ilumatobacteraceae bacterium]
MGSHTTTWWRVRKHAYTKPLAYMREYLTEMDEAMFSPSPRPRSLSG